jgi:hypothetical protein
MSSEKIEAFWQDATAEDVAGMIKTGELVPARLRDSGADDWQEGLLAGWKLRGSGARWIDSDGATWNHCQVYREPSWHANKPDPGPGWRLLGKLPDEPLAVCDEFFHAGWHPSCREIGDMQTPGAWYRRRIELVEPKFAVGQTVRVVGPKQIPALEWSSVGMAHYAGTTQTIERVELLTNPPGTYYHLKGIVNWCFREDYLEPVEPEPRSILTDWQCREGDTYRHPNGLTLKVTEKGFEVTQ